MPYEQTRASILANSGAQLLAEDRNYHGGVIEAYLAVDAVVVVARTPGFALHAALKGV